MTDEREWLTIPDICEMLGVTPGRVHRLLEERQLLGKRINGILSVPRGFFVDDVPLPEIRGTALVLLDGGFNEDHALDWFITHDETLGATPLEALRSGRKSEVRRLAQSLAL